MIGSGSSSSPTDTNQTPTQTPTDEEQQKINELTAQWSNMTFEEDAIPSLAQKILSNELEDLYYGLIGIRKLLSKENNPPIQPVIDTNSVPRLVSLMSTGSADKIKFEAAWCLTNLCSGTTQQTQFCIENGAIPAFIEMLKLQDPEAVEQAVWGLGNIAGDNSKFRDIILHSNGVQAMVQVLQNAANVGLKRNGAWALSNFCRGKPNPQYSLVSGAIPLFSDYLKTEIDQQILTDVAWGLSYITTSEQGVEGFVAQNAISNLVQHLSSNDPGLVTPCLRTLGNIVSGTEQQTSAVVKEKNFFPELFKLAVSPKKGIRREVFWTISNITAGTPIQFEGIMGNPSYVEIIINAAKTDVPDVKKEAVWALSNSTATCTPAQIIRILNNGVYACLVGLLQDQDQKVLLVALEGIQNCLKWGKQFNLNNDSGENKFVAELEEKGGLDSLENLQSHPNHEVYEGAVKILEEYFALEEEECEQEA